MITANLLDVRKFRIMVIVYVCFTLSCYPFYLDLFIELLLQIKTVVSISDFYHFFETLLYPPQTVFVGGYTVFRSVRTNDRPIECVFVMLCFLNNFKNHRWNFIKFCKHIHMYKANTTNKKSRARGQCCLSYFPL